MIRGWSVGCSQVELNGLLWMKVFNIAKACGRYILVIQNDVLYSIVKHILVIYHKHQKN